MGIREDLMNWLNGYKEDEQENPEPKEEEPKKEDIKEEPKKVEPKEDERDILIKTLRDENNILKETNKSQSEQINKLKEFTHTTKSENKELTLQEAIMKGEF